MCNYVEMKIPTLNDIGRASLRFKKFSIPFLLVNIALMGVLIYRLANSNSISNDEKKKLSYAEIGLSLAGGLPVLYIFIMLFIVTIYIHTTHVYIPLSSFVKLILFGVLFIVFNQLTLTGLRMFLHDVLSEQQQNIISGITIPVIIINSYFTLGFFSVSSTY